MGKLETVLRAVGLSLLVYVAALVIGEAVLYLITAGDGFLSEEMRSLIADDPEGQADAAGSVMIWFLVSVAISWVCAAVFLVLCGLKSPATQADERSGAPFWFLLLVASEVGVNAYAWVTFALRALSADLDGVFTPLAVLAANLLLLITYWLATVFAVPHRMGPSVPLRHLVVRLSK